MKLLKDDTAIVTLRIIAIGNRRRVHDEEKAELFTRRGEMINDDD